MARNPLLPATMPAPWTVIGYRRDGRPIYAIGGASTDGDGTDTGDDKGGKPADDADADKGGDTKPDPDELGDKGKKALQQERSARAAAEKRANDLAAKVKEFEDKDKSDLERAQGDADSHKSRAEKAELHAARLEIALEKGLTPSQAKRLVGSTREELQADADELLADLGTAAAGKGKSAPGGTADQGATDKTTPTIDEQIKAAEAKGDYKTARALKLTQFANKS